MQLKLHVPFCIWILFTKQGTNNVRKKQTDNEVCGGPTAFRPINFWQLAFWPFLCTQTTCTATVRSNTTRHGTHLTEIENLSTTGNNEILVPPASLFLYPIYVKSLKIKPLQIPNNFLVFYATHLQFLRNTYSCFYI